MRVMNNNNNNNTFGVCVPVKSVVHRVLCLHHDDKKTSHIAAFMPYLICRPSCMVVDFFVFGRGVWGFVHVYGLLLSKHQPVNSLFRRQDPIFFLRLLVTEAQSEKGEKATQTKKTLKHYETKNHRRRT